MRTYQAVEVTGVRQFSLATRVMSDPAPGTTWSSSAV